MNNPRVLEYRRPPEPILSEPPAPGAMMNVSALIGLIVGTGAIATCIISGMWAMDGDWGLFKSSMLIVFAGLLLDMEYRAYFRHSVKASTIAGLAFSMLDVVMLYTVLAEIDWDHKSPPHPNLILIPFTICLFAAIGHFDWARRLERSLGSG